MKLSKYLKTLIIESLEIEQDIEDLKNSSGKAKLEKLKNLTSDPNIFKEILYYAYNPFLKFNVVKIPNLQFKGNKTINSTTWENYKKLLISLSERKISGHAAINAVRTFLSDFTPQSGQILANVLKKDLRIGMDATSINKVFPGLIPTFGVMLAQKYGKGAVDIQTDPFKLPWKKTYVSRKLDGLRLVAIKENGQVELRSRQGKIYPHFDNIRNQLTSLPIDNVMFDGEVVIMDKNEADNFSKITSIARTKEKTELDNQAIYLIFDLVDLEEFKTKNFTKPFYVRFEQLKQVFGLKGVDLKNFILSTPYKNLFVVNQIKVDNSEQFKELFRMSQEKNWEGLMLRKMTGLYTTKRTSELQKVKAFMDEEFPIVGYYEGEGKNKGKLGGFIIQINKKGDTVRVGSGYSDEQREEFWKKRKQLIGKKITVKFKHYSVDKTGKQSLNFPVFKDIEREKAEG